MQEKIQDTVIVYNYRYIWKTKDGNLNVKYVTNTLEGHGDFIKAIRNDSNIVSALREYQHEINFAFIGFTEPVKEEKKEEKGV